VKYHVVPFDKTEHHALAFLSRPTRPGQSPKPPGQIKGDEPRDSSVQPKQSKESEPGECSIQPLQSKGDEPGGCSKEPHQIKGDEPGECSKQSSKGKGKEDVPPTTEGNDGVHDPRLDKFEALISAMMITFKTEIVQELQEKFGARNRSVSQTILPQNLEVVGTLLTWIISDEKARSAKEEEE
jgi:hypothetical protein